MPKKIVINGKGKGAKKAAAPVQPQISPSDQEIEAKVEELHVFLTQRGLPYLLVTRRSDRTTIGRYSFNHEHNKPQITMENAEWVFGNVGAMIRGITNGVVNVVKTY
jgi:hypothetical protein